MVRRLVSSAGARHAGARQAPGLPALVAVGMALMLCAALPEVTCPLLGRFRLATLAAAGMGDADMGGKVTTPPPPWPGRARRPRRRGAAGRWPGASPAPAGRARARWGSAGYRAAG